jgi:hypothetical protein
VSQASGNPVLVKDIANVMRRLRPDLVENLESLITQQLTNRSR